MSLSIAHFPCGASVWLSALLLLASFPAEAALAHVQEQLRVEMEHVEVGITLLSAVCPSATTDYFGFFIHPNISSGMS